MEFNSIPSIFFFNSIHFLHDSLSSLCSHPLFSTIVTLYTLILLYAPSLFLTIAFSPIFNSTGILLLSLLRLGTNERSEKESSSPESRSLDPDHNHPKWLPIEGSNIFLYSGLDLESNSMESRFLDFVDQSQTHVEFEPKTGLGSKFNQIHVESRPKTGLGTESNQTPVESEPNTSLSTKSNQTHAEFEVKVGLGSKSNQTHVGSEPKTSLSTDSNQPHVEYKPKTGLSMESDQIHVEFEPEIVLGPESNRTHLESELKLGSESNSQDDYNKWELLKTISMESPKVGEEEDPRMEMDSEQVDTTTTFLEWNMRAPLEVIYEAYEGEEEDDDDDDKSNENDDVSGEKPVDGPVRYPSLSMYYPESDTDSSSDGEFRVIGNWETQESVFFKWEEEEREELIEISLDRYGKRGVEFRHVEEDNLIEIDIFQREIEHSGEKVFRRG